MFNSIFVVKFCIKSSVKLYTYHNEKFISYNSFHMKQFFEKCRFLAHSPGLGNLLLKQGFTTHHQLISRAVTRLTAQWTLDKQPSRTTTTTTKMDDGWRQCETPRYGNWIDAKVHDKTRCLFSHYYHLLPRRSMQGDSLLILMCTALTFKASI